MIESDVADDATTWRAWRRGTVVGTATAQPGSEAGAGFLRLWVAPDHRRDGVGSRLLDAVVAAARAEGCVILETVVEAGSPGNRFARHRGAQVGDELVEMTLDLGVPAFDDLRELARPPEGYRLVHWWGGSPEGWLASYAAARRHLTDAPNAHPPPVQGRTPDEMRKLEASRTGTFLTTAAVREATVVAFTELATYDTPTADQHDTAVHPEHRGLGLATAVKAEAVARLRAEQPEVSMIAATTAVANAGMRAVNRRLGFVETRRRTLLRLPLD